MEVPPPPPDDDRRDRRASARAAPPAPVPFAEGDVVRGVVRAVQPFGVFVRVDGWNKDALVHKDAAHDDLTFAADDDPDAVKHSLEYFFPIGHAVYGKVTSIRGDGKVSLDARATCQETGRDLDPDGARTAARRRDRGGGDGDGDGRPRFGGGGGGGGPGGGYGGGGAPEVGRVYKATVRSVKPVGAFVDIEGFRRGGLVHRSQISQYLDVPRDADDEAKVGIISGVLGVGDAAYVKVMDVEKSENGRDVRVSLSMKYVDQGTGEDMDPNNLNYDPPFRGGGGGRGGDRYAPVGANAADTVKAGAIRWGHHAGDVKQYGSGGQQYDLVLDDNVIEEEAPPPGMMFGSGEFVTRLRAAGGSPTRVRDGKDERDRERKRHKREKKEKKEKKSKRHKKSSSHKRSRRDYSSDSSSYSRSR